MYKKIDNPHDTRAKILFSNKKTFLSLLRDCVKTEWVDDIDPASLRKMDKSFILPDFSGKEADIVYEAVFDGQKIIFYVLLELQSGVDFTMPYRLLLYIVEILRDFYNNSDTKARGNKDFRFPAVYPLVFYSGGGEWTAPVSLKEIFGAYEVFGSNILNFDYALVPVKGYTKEDLQLFSSKLLGLAMLLEKSRSETEFIESLRQSYDAIKTFDEEEQRILNAYIKIMENAYGFDTRGAIQILTADSEREKEADQMLSDVLEYAKVKDAKLLEQGIKTGIKRGIKTGKLEVAREMLRENYSVDSIMRITKLSKEQIEALK